MEPVSGISMNDADAKRAEELFQQHLLARHVNGDRMFAMLMVLRWAFAVTLAVLVSPYAWAGKVREFHPHLYAAIFMGAGLTVFPVLLALYRPGHALTRYVMAVSQMLWSALLIHLTGGRIETHFHVFVSLAFLAFYKDWRVLVPASLTVVADHFLRGMYWPESVYGTSTLQWWRVFEHAGWVVFEDIVLALSCLRAVAQDRDIAERDAGLEAAHAGVEQQVVERTQQLEAEITERKAQARELSRARIAAEAASRAKSEFISTVS